MVITRAAWHSTALEPAEVSQSAYDAWQVEKERQARQAAVAARAGTRDGDGVKSGARKDREDPRKAVPKRDKPGPDRDKRDAGARADAAPAAPVKGGKALPPWAVAVGALFTVAMVSGIVALSTGGHRDPPPPTRVDAYDVRNALEQVAPHVPFVSAKVDDAGLHVVIGSDWMSRTTSQRQADVENMTLALTNLRFETIHYATPDGTEHATFRGGSYVIAGQQQAEPVEK
jgi:hypothetical protein